MNLYHITGSFPGCCLGRLLQYKSQGAYFLVVLSPDAQGSQIRCSSGCQVTAVCHEQQVLLTLAPILIQAASIMHSPFQPKNCCRQPTAWRSPVICLAYQNARFDTTSLMIMLTGTLTTADCNVLSQSL